MLNKRPPEIRKVSLPSKRSMRQVYRLLALPVPLRDMHEASAPSITMSDMLANVGLSRRFGEHVSKAKQRRVQAKLKAFDNGRKPRQSPTTVCGVIVA